MKINVKHCTVVKAGLGFRNLLPADGPHEVADDVARELIETKVATAAEPVEPEAKVEDAPPVEAKPEVKPEPEAKVEPKTRPKGSKYL